MMKEINKDHGIMTVPEWLFDRISNEAHGRFIALNGEYKTENIGGNEMSVLDHTKLRVEAVLAQTEKAVKVQLDAETFGGRWCGWTTWIPKSQIAEF